MLDMYETLEEVLKDFLRLIVIKEDTGEPVDDLVLKTISVARDAGFDAGFFVHHDINEKETLLGYIVLPTGSVAWSI